LRFSLVWENLLIKEIPASARVLHLSFLFPKPRTSPRFCWKISAACVYNTWGAATRRPAWWRSAARGDSTGRAPRGSGYASGMKHSGPAGSFAPQLPHDFSMSNEHRLTPNKNQTEFGRQRSPSRLATGGSLCRVEWWCSGDHKGHFGDSGRHTSCVKAVLHKIVVHQCRPSRTKCLLWTSDKLSRRRFSSFDLQIGPTCFKI